MAFVSALALFLSIVGGPWPERYTATQHQLQPAGAAQAQGAGTRQPALPIIPGDGK